MDNGLSPLCFKGVLDKFWEKIEIEKSKQNEKANSVDPDHMAHMSHLVWIYSVKAFFQACSVEGPN